MLRILRLLLTLSSPFRLRVISHVSCPPPPTSWWISTCPRLSTKYPPLYSAGSPSSPLCFGLITFLRGFIWWLCWQWQLSGFQQDPYRRLKPFNGRVGSEGGGVCKRADPRMKCSSDKDAIAREMTHRCQAVNYCRAPKLVTLMLRSLSCLFTRLLANIIRLLFVLNHWFQAHVLP